ncbi:unnamed protein product [Withania somnifera]
MSAETKPVITSLSWKSQHLHEFKSPYISETSSIPELISYLKSAFRDNEYSLVEGILLDREKKLCTEIQNLKRDLANKNENLVDMENMEKIFEELKNEKDEAEAKLEMYEEKFKEGSSEKRAVDVAVIRKTVEDLEAAEDEEEVVEVNSEGSGAEQLSNGNGSGKSGDKGSGNTDFVSAKMKLVNCPDVQTLHPKPSALVNSNVSNREKKRCHSVEADPLPINLACENRAPILYLSACEPEVCVMNNLDTVSGRAGSSTVVHISDSDDENAKACVSKSNGVGRNLTFLHQIKEENVRDTSLSKRKRSSSDSDNDDGSSFRKQKTGSSQELNRDRKLSFSHDNSHKTVFVRRCDDKDGGKFYSHLSSKRSDLYKLDGLGDDSSSDSEDDLLSDKNMNMFIQKITRRRMFSSEDDLRSSFEKDPELCMSAVCALYRKYISPNISSKGLYFTTSQVLSQSDKMSIGALGEYLIDGDPENKLRKAVEEVRPKDHAECKRLATNYCHQLYQIYLNKEDHLFYLISKF